MNLQINASTLSPTSYCKYHTISVPPNYATSPNFTETEEIGAEIRVCRAVKCYQKDEDDPASSQTRLIFSISQNDKLRRTLRPSLQQLGAEWHTGKAPASGIERQLQVWLDSLAA